MPRLCFLGTIVAASFAIAPGDLQTSRDSRPRPAVDRIQPHRTTPSKSVLIRLTAVKAEVELAYRRLKDGTAVLALYTPIVKLSDEGEHDRMKGKREEIEYLQPITDEWLDASGKQLGPAQYCIVLNGELLKATDFWVEPPAEGPLPQASVLKKQQWLATSHVTELLERKASGELVAMLLSAETIPALTSEERTRITDAIAQDSIVVTGQIETATSGKLVVQDSAVVFGKAAETPTGVERIEVPIATDTACTQAGQTRSCGKVAGMRATIVLSVRKLGRLLAKTVDVVVPGK